MLSELLFVQFNQAFDGFRQICALLLRRPKMALLQPGRGGIKGDGTLGRLACDYRHSDRRHRSDDQQAGIRIIGCNDRTFARSPDHGFVLQNPHRCQARQGGNS
jgi:hypothetical protein